MNNKELLVKIMKPMKERRKFFRITQKQMAEKIGHKSSTYIALIESGERNVNVCDYVLWREALGMSLNFIHEYEDLSEDWKGEQDPFKRVEKYKEKSEVGGVN